MTKQLYKSEQIIESYNYKGFGITIIQNNITFPTTYTGHIKQLYSYWNKNSVEVVKHELEGAIDTLLPNTWEELVESLEEVSEAGCGGGTVPVELLKPIVTYFVQSNPELFSRNFAKDEDVSRITEELSEKYKDVLKELGK